MSDPRSADGTPQFSTAEYPGAAGTNLCKSCNQAISGNYYRVNGVMACPACAARVKSQIPRDSHAAFTRGLLFGIGGAILGLVLYAAFGIITGWMIGYVSLAVGYIVGKAIRLGSGGIGGRRYQIAALALTYGAVSLAAIPIWVAQVSKARKAARTELSQPLQSPSEQPSANAPPAPQQKPASASRPPNVGRAIVTLVFIGLASPFLELRDPVHGMLGLVILFVGIRIAWQIARGTSIQILGPFKSPKPASVAVNSG